MNYKYRVWRCPMNTPYRFRDWDCAVKHGFGMEAYVNVWNGNVTAKTEEEALDIIYENLNINHPSGYNIASLSMSDIVEINGHRYYCDDIGWKDIDAKPKRKEGLSLLEFLERDKCEDYDAYDDTYDISICVTFPEPYDDDELDWHTEFCKKLFAATKFLKAEHNHGIVVDWAGLVESNMKVFREFAKNHWYKNYTEDDDDLTYEWLRELEKLVSGYGNDTIYKLFIDEILTSIN